MRGIEECVCWMIVNEPESLESEDGEIWVWYNNGRFYRQHPERSGAERLETLKHLGGKEWKPLPKKVDFMTAINSGKKIYPVEYFDEGNNRRLESSYINEMECGKEYVGDGVFKWLYEHVEPEHQLKHINGMWYIEE